MHGAQAACIVEHVERCAGKFLAEFRELPEPKQVEEAPEFVPTSLFETGARTDYNICAESHAARMLITYYVLSVRRKIRTR